MKQLLIKVAALFGLVPARRYHSVAQQLDETRSSARAWKTRASEALARVKSVERDLQRQSRLVDEARRAAEKIQQGDRSAKELREQLAKTERQLTLAREHLMAIEVKLDILEGAANVLESRTRSAIRSSGTGAQV